MLLIIRRMFPGKMIHPDMNPVPAAVPDQWNFLLSGIWNQVAHLVIRFDGPLDRERVGRAIERVLLAEPLAGSRFVEDESPYFQPIEGLSLENLFVSRSAGDGDPGNACTSPGPGAREGPMIRVTHLRSGSDTLVLSVNHTLCDARGMKYLATLLAGFYRDPTAPIPLPDPGERGFSRLFSRFYPGTLYRAWMAAGETTRVWGVPMKKARSGACFITRTLPSGIFLPVRTWCKTRGYTLNDLLLAAYYEALSPFAGDSGEPLPILCAMDLRQLAPCTIAECANGSVAFEVRIPPRDSAEPLVDAVHLAMAGHKRDHTGLGVAMRQYEDFEGGFQAVKTRLQELENLSAAGEEKMNPFFSNTGILSGELLDFGEPGVLDARILPPVEYPPGFGLAVSTFSEKITLSAGICTDALPVSEAEAILARMEAFIRDIAGSG
jgi:NRPS condensation-like uncharacterized protein